MFTKVRNWFAFLVVGPLVGFALVSLAIAAGYGTGTPGVALVLFAAFTMIVLPMLGLRMAWWTFKVAMKRRIEREVDLRFVSAHGRQIRDARARSW